MINIPGPIPIRIHFFFWVVIFVIGWLNTSTLAGMFIWAIVIFISILVHEYGHALTAMLFGQRAEIDLMGFGGLTTRQGKKIQKWKEFIVIFNGPLAGFLLLYLTYKIRPLIDMRHMSYLSYAAQVSIYVNLFWNILNLLPILPLDGGQLLKVGCESIFKFKGIRISLIISIIFGLIISGLFFLTQAFLAGALFLIITFENFRMWNELKHVTPQDTSDHLQNLMKEAQLDLNMGRDDEALIKLDALRDETKKGKIYVTATEDVARVFAKQGKFREAYDILVPIQNQLSDDYLFLLQQLSYRMEDWERTVKIGNDLYRSLPLNEVALMNAYAYALMDKVIPAVGWLRSAFQAGLQNAKDILSKREFDSIRQSKEFQALQKQFIGN